MQMKDHSSFQVEMKFFGNKNSDVFWKWYAY